MLCNACTLASREYTNEFELTSHGKWLPFDTWMMSPTLKSSSHALVGALLASMWICGAGR